MKTEFIKIRIFTLGGILSPGNLIKIIEVAREIGTENLQFGMRQDLIMMCNIKFKDVILEKLEVCGYQCEIVEHFNSRNIVTSYPASSIFHNTSWLRTGTYYSILEQFVEVPSLKVNIVDPMQGLSPILSGHINFIASEKRDYWYLFLRYPYEQKYHLWGYYILSDDIPKLAYFLTNCIVEEGIRDLAELRIAVSEEFQGDMPVVSKQPEYPLVNLPNYDGMHQMGDKFWIGFYRRKNDFSVEFLNELSLLCNKLRIGKISVTPWHSIIVKNINKEDLILMEILLGKHKISVQHSWLELNWQIPTLDEKAAQIKEYVYQEFDNRDVRTNGLTFGVRSREVELTTSVVISPDENDRFTVSYSRDFNQNNREYFDYKKDVSLEDLPDVLLGVCELYNKNLISQSKVIIDYDALGSEDTKNEVVRRDKYECPNCLSVYDSKYGDLSKEIIKGTYFDLLPSDYVCSTCDTSKDEFVKI